MWASLEVALPVSELQRLTHALGIRVKPARRASEGIGLGRASGLRAVPAIELAFATVVAVGATAGLGAEPKPASPKKALVELYTSQGCDMCPAADQLLARLGALGSGSDRIIPLSFHVDYFNDPWKDPFSDAAYSQREMAYNTALNRKDLYFTPMMMIDGRHPMLGSDQARAQAALKDVLKEKPGVLLAVDLVKGPEDPNRKTLKVTVTGVAAEVAGRDLLVGAALFENPTTTTVPSGENAGKTLVEHGTVRKFVYQKVQLDSSRPSDLSFPLELPADAKAARCGVAVFVQDWLKGKVHQADAVSWTGGSDPGSGVPVTKRSSRVQRGPAR